MVGFFVLLLITPVSIAVLLKLEKIIKNFIERSVKKDFYLVNKGLKKILRYINKE